MYRVDYLHRCSPETFLLCYKCFSICQKILWGLLCWWMQVLWVLIDKQTQCTASKHQSLYKDLTPSKESAKQCVTNCMCDWTNTNINQRKPDKRFSALAKVPFTSRNLACIWRSSSIDLTSLSLAICFCCQGSRFGFICLFPTGGTISYFTVLFHELSHIKILFTCLTWIWGIQLDSFLSVMFGLFLPHFLSVASVLSYCKIFISFLNTVLNT